MIHFTIPQLYFSVPAFVLFFGAVAVAIAVLRPYVPAWALFAFDVGFTLFWLMLIHGDEPTLPRITMSIIGVIVAATLWWRNLRGREWKNPS